MIWNSKYFRRFFLCVQGLGCYGLRSKYCEDWNQELEEESRRLTLATPWCFKLNLKRIVVYDYSGWEKEIIYIKLLLKYALVLKELILFSVFPTPALESTLQNLSRASQTCSIKLQVGIYSSFLRP